MEKIILRCTEQHQRYKIVAENDNKNLQVALAGFCAKEYTENILLNQLQNICLQSNGSFSILHALLKNVVPQWQHSFNMPTVQILQLLADSFLQQKLTSMLVYKGVGNDEKIIRRIFL